MILSILKFFFWLILALCSVVAAGLGGTFLYLNPSQPSVESLRRIQLQIPLRVYSQDGKLIAEFGEMRRAPVRFNDIPQDFINALLAAEDDNFANHYGVDPSSLMRAASQLLKTGHIQTGGSTITMQVAKNYFLTSERSFSRKINEILLALQIERELNKEEILELYVNKIYLGSRAYGIEAAAQVYYGKSIRELSVAQMALIAGLPKAPSAFNPLVNPQRSRERRDWILGRMNRLGLLDDSRYRLALQEPVDARYHVSESELEAPYIAEMARSEMVGRYGAAAYTEGFRVYTTVSSGRQELAIQSLIEGLMDYDKRHGYRGPEARWAGLSRQELLHKLAQSKVLAGLHPAVVTRVDAQSIQVLLRDGSLQSVAWESMRWARPFITVDSLGAAPRRPADVVKLGDVIRVRQDPTQEGSWVFTQTPQVQAALVSLSPKDGAIEALVGGLSFGQSNYNRAVQAKRQPGSSFKPFIYSAALDAGYTASSLINDAPIVYMEEGMDKAWRPKNDNNTFLGPIRMREALYRSRNLVSIRLLRSIGIDYAIDYMTRFGFNRQDLPRNLSIALGTAALSPLEIATGWSVFANGGYRIEPYLIERIESHQGELLMQANPKRVPENTGLVQQPVEHNTVMSPLVSPEPVLPLPAVAERAIDERTAYIMTSMLKDVITKGTGRKALELGRQDLAGKTGTTNDAVDSWFSGYNPDVVTTVWVGFDQPQTLGSKEYGASVALPIWMHYMGGVLKDRPEHNLPEPAGLVTLRVDPVSGRAVSPRASNAYFEVFKSEDTPPPASEVGLEGRTIESPMPASEISDIPAVPLDLF